MDSSLDDILDMLDILVSLIPMFYCLFRRINDDHNQPIIKTHCVVRTKSIRRVGCEVTVPVP